MSLVVSLVLLSVASFAKAAANDKCTLEQTIDLNTAVALATADYVEAVTVLAQSATNASYLAERSLEAYRIFQERIGKAVDALSNALN